MSDKSFNIVVGALRLVTWVMFLYGLTAIMLGEDVRDDREDRREDPGYRNGSQFSKGVRNA